MLLSGTLYQLVAMLSHNFSHIASAAAIPYVKESLYAVGMEAKKFNPCLE